METKNIFRCRSCQCIFVTAFNLWLSISFFNFHSLYLYLFCTYLSRSQCKHTFGNLIPIFSMKWREHDSLFETWTAFFSLLRFVWNWRYNIFFLLFFSPQYSCMHKISLRLKLDGLYSSKLNCVSILVIITINTHLP